MYFHSLLPCCPSPMRWYSTKFPCAFGFISLQNQTSNICWLSSLKYSDTALENRARHNCLSPSPEIFRSFFSPLISSNIYYMLYLKLFLSPNRASLKVSAYSFGKYFLNLPLIIFSLFPSWNFFYHIHVILTAHLYYCASYPTPHTHNFRKILWNIS